ncbi:MAG: RNA polymerase sigma factor [Ignavibacteriales bacterium]|nr:RNA polymerase sigma factor [Ignavibacteriales bacterium]
MRRNIPDLSLKDDQIIVSILNGNKNNYELLMRRYNERLYRIGISILKNDEETEDAMQETYIKAYQHLNKFKRQSQFSTWLSRIMINESLANLKRKKHHAEYSEVESDTQYGIVQQATASNSATPEKQMLQKELKNILEHAIQQLPQKYQTVFVMREIEGMNVQETAECLNISSENVKVRLHRAKEILKTQIRSFSQESEIFSFQDTRCDRIVHAVLNDARTTCFT